MKVGLTECIVEPVNPKTLLYKVRLQLRAIATQKDEEEEGEMNTRFGDGSQDGADTEEDKKVRAEKGVLPDDEEESEVRSKKQAEETVMEDYTKPKKSNYQEEAIDGYYKGSNKKHEDVDIDYGEDKEKQKYQEEAIDGHYKGNLKKAEYEEEEEDTPKKKTKLELEEEEIEALKHELNLEAENNLNHHKKKEILEFEEETKEKKKAVQLDIEEQKAEREKSDREAEDLGGHYKGKVNKKLDIEEEDSEFLDKVEEDHIDEEKKKKTAKLEILEDEKDDFVDKVEEEELESQARKKKPKFEINDDDSKDMHQEAEAYEEGPIIKEKRAKLEVTEENEKDPLKKEVLLEEEKEKKKHGNIADDIDGYLRGGAAKKGLTLEDEEDIYNDESLAEEMADKKKKRAALELEEDEIEKDPLLGEKEYDEDLDKKKKAEKLLLEDDDPGDKATGASQDEELEKERRKSSYQEGDLGFGKGQGKGSTDKIENASNRSNARADQIKTHYSSKESIKHGDQDWDVQWEKQEKEQEEFPKEKREENALIIEKEDLGEQTIDYGKLKAEFEGISIDGVANKKKEYGSFENVAEIKTYKKTILSPEGELEEMEFEEVMTQEEEESGHQVFEPNSLGMEIAIQIQNFYFTKDIEAKDVCEFMHKMVKKQFRGSTLFYSFAHSKEIETTLFNGSIFEEQGAPPKKPSNDELEQMPRKERKELEADYAEDLKEYIAIKNTILDNFKGKYSGEFINWLEYRFPTWKDETFQDPENIFIFPFYEGETILGLGVFIPDSDFNIEKADALEAVFEVARGIIMTDYHQAKGEGKLREATKKEDTSKKKGLFGKLFGSKAS